MNDKIILHSKFYILIKMIKQYNNITNADLIKNAKISKQVISLVESQKIHSLKLSTYKELLKALSNFEIAPNTYITYITYKE